MELYILSKENLKILDIQKVTEYEINIDEETNAKSNFKLFKNEHIKDGNYILINGLFRQFIFVIPEGGVITEKSSNIVNVTALDISNIFDRKIIEKNIHKMSSISIESYIASMISENFANSDDTYTNIPYIDIYWSTNTKGIVATNSENGLYNFHTFLINCRQYKNIYTEFKITNGKLRIDISNKNDDPKLIDTTLSEISDYNKIYETSITAKVEVLIREDNSTYNLYLKNDRTTTTNKDDPDRAVGNIEVISVETADKAPEEALNVIKGNSYKHLVEFKIPKNSQLIDVTQLYVGRKIIIKTNEDIYNIYISAMILTDENYIYFRSGTLRINFLEKIKKNETNSFGNKLDLSGGVITGNVNIKGNFLLNDKSLKGETIYSNVAGETLSVTLDKDVSEFAVIDIFYINFDGYYNSVRVENPNGNLFSEFKREWYIFQSCYS